MHDLVGPQLCYKCGCNIIIIIHSLLAPPWRQSGGKGTVPGIWACSGGACCFSSGSIVRCSHGNLNAGADPFYD